MPAIINRACSTTNCTNRIDERSMTGAGLHFLTSAWLAAVAAGTTTKCLPCYLTVDVPTVYAAYVKGDGHRGNRDKA